MDDLADLPPSPWADPSCFAPGGQVRDLAVPAGEIPLVHATDRWMMLQKLAPALIEALSSGPPAPRDPLNRHQPTAALPCPAAEAKHRKLRSFSAW